MNICPVCNDFIFRSSTHQCQPEWEVCLPDFSGDDWTIVRAHDSEDAAEKFAERCDDQHNLLGDSAGWLVKVRKLGDSVVETFKVYAEADVNYYAFIEKDVQ